MAGLLGVSTWFNDLDSAILSLGLAFCQCVSQGVYIFALTLAFAAGFIIAQGHKLCWICRLCCSAHMSHTAQSRVFNMFGATARHCVVQVRLWWSYLSHGFRSLMAVDECWWMLNVDDLDKVANELLMLHVTVNSGSIATVWPSDINFVSLQETIENQALLTSCFAWVAAK